jgi:hypothetical protein
MKGLTVMLAEAPVAVREYVSGEIKATKKLAKINCRGKKGLSYDLCEAKAFIYLNPELVEAIFAGQLWNFPKGFKEKRMLAAVL